MKVILDTNVFISGIFWSGPPYKILKAWQNQKISLVISQEIMDEYNRVSKFLSKQYPNIDLTPFIELLAINSKMYDPPNLREPVSRDPDDDKFIACALAANVKFIISGNKDLLTISGYEGISVIKPGLFVKQNQNLFYLSFSKAAQCCYTKTAAYAAVLSMHHLTRSRRVKPFVALLCA